MEYRWRVATFSVSKLIVSRQCQHQMHESPKADLQETETYVSEFYQYAQLSIRRQHGRSRRLEAELRMRTYFLRSNLENETTIPHPCSVFRVSHVSKCFVPDPSFPRQRSDDQRASKSLAGSSTPWTIEPVPPTCRPILWFP